MASIQGHYDPFHPRLLERNEAQLDAILEAFATDHPKQLKFERRKDRRSRDQIEELALQRSEHLVGKAREDWNSRVRFQLPEQFRRSTQRPQRIPTPEQQAAMKPPSGPKGRQ